MNEFIDELQGQLDEDPSSRIFYKLGELFRREGRAEKAAEVLRQGLEHHPRYVAAWVALGRAQVGMGDHDAAQESFARALELDPENPVAARLLGESAAASGDWLRAVKGLKLARALSPGDDALDQKIAEVESHLADGGMLQAGPAPRHEASAASPPAVDEPQPPSPEREEPFGEPADPFGVTEEDDVSGDEAPAEGDDPFAITQEDPFSPAVAAAPGQGGDVFMLADGDEEPFAVSATADGGAWELGEDVFTGDPEPPELVPEDETPEEDAGSAVVTPTLDEAGVPAEEEELGAAADAVEPTEVDRAPAAAPSDDEKVETEASRPEQAWSDDEPWEEEAAAFEGETVPGELPLPTLTLARLAVDQGDLDLAEKTLRGLLARDPGNEPAAELLRDILDQGPKTMPLDAATRLQARKVSALQGWLQGIRLAAERSAR